MKNIITLLLLLVSNIIYAQEFTGLDLKNIVNEVSWKPVKKLNVLKGNEIGLFFLKANSDKNLIKQLNIEGWAMCEHYKIDNFELYNYYYTNISRYTYNKYCNEINALMFLDGILIQNKP